MRIHKIKPSSDDRQSRDGVSTGYAYALLLLTIIFGWEVIIDNLLIPLIIEAKEIHQTTPHHININLP